MVQLRFNSACSVQGLCAKTVAQLRPQINAGEHKDSVSSVKALLYYNALNIQGQN